MNDLDKKRKLIVAAAGAVIALDNTATIIAIHEVLEQEEEAIHKKKMKKIERDNQDWMCNNMLEHESPTLPLIRQDPLTSYFQDLPRNYCKHLTSLYAIFSGTFTRSYNKTTVFTGNCTTV